MTSFQQIGVPMVEDLNTLAWAVTVHKSQGFMFGRIKHGLGKEEFSTGLTFVLVVLVVPSWVKALPVNSIILINSDQILF
jgi:hypothetical protein